MFFSPGAPANIDDHRDDDDDDDDDYHGGGYYCNLHLFCTAVISRYYAVNSIKLSIHFYTIVVKTSSVDCLREKRFKLSIAIV